MIAFAVLTGVLPKFGVLVLAGLAAAALLAKNERTRSAAVIGALLLAPALLLADIWHSPQLSAIHHHPAVAAAAALAGLVLVSAAAAWIARRPALLGILAVLAVPFRIPIEAGGTNSNLLVPLYLVVAAGSLASAVPVLLRTRRSAFRQAPTEPGGAAAADGGPRGHGPGLVERLLALYIAVYALQAVYSPDFEKALQQMVFFYVPFALLFALLRRLDWTPRLIRNLLGTVGGLAIIFALLGFVEYATKTILLNPKLIAANDVHAYFTVNSVFFDPDIFGRFLALVMISLAAVLLFARRSREQIAASVVLAILWGGLVLTLSRSSLGALLIGLGTLAAFRWSARRTLVFGVVVIASGAIAITASPKTFGLNQGLNGASSGRADLVTGGIDLFGARPVWGFGSGSFVYEYQTHHPGSATTLSASHTIPITIGAEQGVVGEVVYIALVLVAVMTLLGGARGDPVRAAVAAAFLALLFHTLLYADFLEDPLTWTLLGIGTALAVSARDRSRVREQHAGPRALDHLRGRSGAVQA